MQVVAGQRMKRKLFTQELLAWSFCQDNYMGPRDLHAILKRLNVFLEENEDSYVVL
jgi:hypothetical protein